MVLLHSHIARSFGNQTVWLTLIFFFLMSFVSEVFFGYLCLCVCIVFDYPFVLFMKLHLHLWLDI